MILKEFWHCAVVYQRGQTLSDGSLAHSGISYHEHVGFKLFGQHRDDFIEFGGSPDQGLQFVISCSLAEIDTVFGEDFVGLIITDHSILDGIVGLPKFDEFFLFQPVLEEVIVCMAV